jgi:hypothetical protein
MCSALERRHAPTGTKGRSPSQRAALFMSGFIFNKEQTSPHFLLACHPLFLSSQRNLIVLADSGVMRL